MSSQEQGWEPSRQAPGRRGQRSGAADRPVVAGAGRRQAPVAFQGEAPGEVWQAEEKYGPYLIRDGGHRVHSRMLAWRADQSCLCTGIDILPDGREAFAGGTEAKLGRCLERALRSWHRPSLIDSDQGKPAGLVADRDPQRWR